MKQLGLLVGEIKLFCGSSTPLGWLVCDGSAVSRTTYSALFSVIGTTYGSGDGSTTFNLPDFRGRTAIGVGNGDATGHTNHTLGQKSGEETHRLTASESGLPEHYNYGDAKYANYGSGSSVGSIILWGEGTAGLHANAQDAQYAHNNMQPYLAVNHIIYAGQ